MALILLQGCFGIGHKSEPDHSQPKVEMQYTWHQALTDGFGEDEANLQLKEAFVRIKEAHAIRGIEYGNTPDALVKSWNTALN